MAGEDSRQDSEATLADSGATEGVAWCALVAHDPQQSPHPQRDHSVREPDPRDAGEHACLRQALAELDEHEVDHRGQHAQNAAPGAAEGATDQEQWHRQQPEKRCRHGRRKAPVEFDPGTRDGLFGGRDEAIRPRQQGAQPQTAQLLRSAPGDSLVAGGEFRTQRLEVELPAAIVGGGNDPTLRERQLHVAAGRTRHPPTTREDGFRDVGHEEQHAAQFISCGGDLPGLEFPAAELGDTPRAEVRPGLLAGDALQGFVEAAIRGWRRDQREQQGKAGHGDGETSQGAHQPRGRNPRGLQGQDLPVRAHSPQGHQRAHQERKGEHPCGYGHRLIESDAGDVGDAEAPVDDQIRESQQILDQDHQRQAEKSKGHRTPDFPLEVAGQRRPGPAARQPVTIHGGTPESRDSVDAPRYSPRGAADGGPC